MELERDALVVRERHAFAPGFADEALAEIETRRVQRDARLVHGAGQEKRHGDAHGVGAEHEQSLVREPGTGEARRRVLERHLVPLPGRDDAARGQAPERRRVRVSLVARSVARRTRLSDPRERVRLAGGVEHFEAARDARAEAERRELDNLRRLIDLRDRALARQAAPRRQVRALRQVEVAPRPERLPVEGDGGLGSARRARAGEADAQRPRARRVHFLGREPDDELDGAAGRDDAGVGGDGVHRAFAGRSVPIRPARVEDVALERQVRHPGVAQGHGVRPRLEHQRRLERDGAFVDVERRVRGDGGDAQRFRLGGVGVEFVRGFGRRESTLHPPRRLSHVRVGRGSRGGGRVGRGGASGSFRVFRRFRLDDVPLLDALVGPPRRAEQARRERRGRRRGLRVGVAGGVRRVRGVAGGAAQREKRLVRALVVRLDRRELDAHLQRGVLCVQPVRRGRLRREGDRDLRGGSRRQVAHPGAERERRRVVGGVDLVVRRPLEPPRLSRDVRE